MSFLKLKIQVSKVEIEMSDIDFIKSLNVLQFIKTQIKVHLAHSQSLQNGTICNL